MYSDNNYRLSLQRLLLLDSVLVTLVAILILYVSLFGHLKKFFWSLFYYFEEQSLVACLTALQVLLIHLSNKILLSTVILKLGWIKNVTSWYPSPFFLSSTLFQSMCSGVLLTIRWLCFQQLFGLALTIDNSAASKQCSFRFNRFLHFSCGKLKHHLTSSLSVA